VPLLKSIFCMKGYDNRTRFFIIISAITSIFMLSSIIFSSASAFVFFLLILLTGAIATSTKRRLNDGELNKNWLLLPCGTFFLVGSIITFTEHHSLYWLLIIPSMLSAILLTYPSKSIEKPYVFGYCGPVDLSGLLQTTNNQRSNRIEPVLAKQPFDPHVYAAIKSDNQAINPPRQVTSNNSNNETDIGEFIRTSLLANKTALIALGAIILLILTTVLISALWPEEDKNSSEINEKINTVETINQKEQRLHPLHMPDDFTLYLSEHGGLIISWNADDNNNMEIWSLLSATGDKSCKAIEFNNADSIRTLSVSVENSSIYFALFSPLDTESLVKSLALRGSFDLCGYKFSLKGSQSVIGKHSKYLDFL